MGWYGFRPYVPVHVRRRQALEKMEKLRKKGLDIQPVSVQGRKITHTFWGEAWCNHIESFHDYENRLPRGRTYVRNGSVCHLEIGTGQINAMVSGTELYKVQVDMKKLPDTKWKNLKTHCSGQIASVLELLQGKLSDNVMAVVTDRNNGLFPLPGEISFKCNCPDWAAMCKHIAAVLYGVGARLDEKPELLFLLRGVEHEELIGAEIALTAGSGEADGGRRRIADDALADVFGIEVADDAAPAAAIKPKQPRQRLEQVVKDSGTMKKATKKRAGSRKKTARAPKPKPSEQAAASGLGAALSNALQNALDTGLAANASRAPEDAAGTRAVRVSGPPVPERTQTGDATRAEPFTGQDVAKLRGRFGMTAREFAALLGVTQQSIGNWERKTGIINLQARTLQALIAVSGQTREEAWEKLGEKRQ